MSLDKLYKNRLVSDYFDRHPMRWVSVRRIACATNHLYHEHFNDRQIRDVLNDLTPVLLEKKKVGSKLYFRHRQDNLLIV